MAVTLRKPAGKHSKPKKRSKAAKASASAEHAYYVYCIGRADELAAHFSGDLPDSLEPGINLELVLADPGRKATPSSGLAAVASAVPMSEYAQEQLEVRLTDPAWTATRAMRHERVVQYFASVVSVIPLRFGAIYLDRGRLRKMMRERSRELLPVLKQLNGKEEWGVDVYSDQAKLRSSILKSSRNATELKDQAARASPGQSYLARKRIDSVGAEEARRESGRVLDVIEAGLGVVSVSYTRLRLLKTDSGQQGKMVGRFAFLVLRRDFGRFQAAAHKLLKSLEPAGFNLELTGPWPPYNFTER